MRPFIFDYSVKRVNDSNEMGLAYTYNHEISLNEVIIEGQATPFIDIPTAELEMETKTRMHRENDDERFLVQSPIETKVSREPTKYFDTLLELETKTFVKKERDDESFANYQ